MNSRILQSGALAILIALLAAPHVACEQQQPKCATGRGDFAARYKMVSGPASCAERKGDKLGLQTYSARGLNDRPDLDRASFAIQAEALGTLVANASSAGVKDEDPSHKPFALGPFANSVPVGDLCLGNQMAPAHQVLPEIKEDADKEVTAQKKADVQYAWANVKIYVTPAAYGTQMTADLTITSNGETCAYAVQAIYPFVDCSKANPDDPMAPATPDDTACAAEAHPPEHATGSGINPDFPVHCDPELLTCVLDREGIPVLR